MPDELAEILKKKRVVIALDNPELESSSNAQHDGRRALKRIREQLPLVTLEVPDAKDWNEQLTRERDQRAHNERQARELDRQQQPGVVGPVVSCRAPGSGSPRP